MANRCMYYFELHQDRTDYIDSWKAGVYSTLGYVGGYTGWQNRLAHNSDRVWMQGPRGGVKIVKDRINYYGGFEYFTSQAVVTVCKRNSNRKCFSTRSARQEWTKTSKHCDITSKSFGSM